MKKNNNELEKIINEIDEICLTTPCDIKELNYAELLYLHLILESHKSFGVFKMPEHEFPHDFDETILDGLIRKKILFLSQINISGLENFFEKNLDSFNKIQKEYFDLLIIKFKDSRVFLTEHQIEYTQLKYLVFNKLQEYTLLNYEDIKGLELLIKNSLRQKALEIFKKSMKKYGFWIEATPTMQNKIDEIVWEFSISKFNHLLTNTCRSISADMRTDNEINKYLNKYFINRLNFFFKNYKTGYEKNESNYTHSSTDNFIQNNLSLSQGELDTLSGSQIINLWIKKPNIKTKFLLASG